MKEQYSSSLNGAAFLLFELKQVAKLKLKGLSNQEIRKKIKEENLFEMEKTGRINRALPSVLKRANALDQKSLELLIERTNEIGRIINLYTIMKTDRLFFEFMDEVVKEKLNQKDYFLEKKDLSLFFSVKMEQSETIAHWSEINKEKLKRAFFQVLFESGLLQKRQGKELNHLMIDEDWKQHLIYIGDAKYIQAMGEEV